MSLRPPKGAFEMAMAHPDRYQAMPCYLVGPIAIHRGHDRQWPWKMSHAASGVGIPGAYGRNLPEAERVARALASAADWSRIKRGPTVGSVRGLTKARRAAIMAMINSFEFLRVDDACGVTASTGPPK